MHWLSYWVGGKYGCLQCCSPFRGSSSIWGASAWSAAKMASQPPTLHSPPKNDPWNSILIYQTRIFCKKNGPKSSILPEIEVQTFYHPLYAVTTACCVPWQIPVRNMKEHSREICYSNMWMATNGQKQGWAPKNDPQARKRKFSGGGSNGKFVAPVLHNASFSNIPLPKI